MEKKDTVIDYTEETAAGFQGSYKSTGFENVKTIIADKLHIDRKSTRLNSSH